jgi:hypothetical protein
VFSLIIVKLDLKVKYESSSFAIQIVWKNITIEHFNDSLSKAAAAEEGNPGRDYILNDLGMLQTGMGLHEEAKRALRLEVSYRRMPAGKISMISQSPCHRRLLTYQA